MARKKERIGLLNNTRIKPVRQRSPKQEKGNFKSQERKESKHPTTKGRENARDGLVEALRFDLHLSRDVTRRKAGVIEQWDARCESFKQTTNHNPQPANRNP